ncbi:MAG: hypothetical protein ACRD4H_07745, partial [Candidatus Acidiferrales bacterium]
TTRQRVSLTLASLAFLCLVGRGRCLYPRDVDSENVRNVVAQSLLGFAEQDGQAKLSGLVGSTSGMEGSGFAMMAQHAIDAGAWLRALCACMIVNEGC